MVELLPSLESVKGIDADIFFKLFISLIVFSLAVLVRKWVLRKIKSRGQKNGQDRRHQMNTVKQMSNGVIFVLLIVIWGSEVQNLAFSVAAFIVAIVLATREFLQCLLGFLYYLFTRPFRVSEWIQVGNDIIGEVYEIDWMKVTVHEVDTDTLTYTGKSVFIPNNQLVTKTLKNLNFNRRYTFHRFHMTLAPDVRIIDHLGAVQSIVDRHCASFKDIALRYKETIERHLDVEFIEVEPSVTIETNNWGLIEMHFSFFCPKELAFELQQKVTVEVLRLGVPLPQRENLGLAQAI